MRDFAEILGLVFVLAGFAIVLMFFAMFAFGGLRPGELKDRIVNVAAGTYMHDGIPIPGVRPPLPARVVLWLARADRDEPSRRG